MVKINYQKFYWKYRSRNSFNFIYEVGQKLLLKIFFNFTKFKAYGV